MTETVRHLAQLLDAGRAIERCKIVAEGQWGSSVELDGDIHTRAWTLLEALSKAAGFPTEAT